MNMVHLCLAALAGVALFRFLVIPWMEVRRKRWAAQTGLPSVAGLTVYSTLEYVQTLLLTIAMAYGGLAVAILLLRSMGGTSYRQVHVALSILDRIGKATDSVSSIWSGIIVCVAALALGILSYRRSHRYFAGRLSEAAWTQLARLNELRERGQLESLPPTPEMLEVKRHLLKLKAQRISRQQPADHGGPGAASEWKKTDDEIEALERLFTLMDLRRRIRLAADEILPSQPETKWSRLTSVIVSKGLLRVFQGGSRLFLLLGLMILFLSLVGAHAGVLAEAASERRVELSQLQIKFSKEAAKESLDRAVAEVAPEKPPPLTPDDQRLANHIARRFEDAFSNCRIAVPDGRWSDWAMAGSVPVTTVIEHDDYLIRPMQIRSKSCIDHGSFITRY